MEKEEWLKKSKPGIKLELGHKNKKRTQLWVSGSNRLLEVKIEKDHGDQETWEALSCLEKI